MQVYPRHQLVSSDDPLFAYSNREIRLETLPDNDDSKHKADVMELFKRTYERVRHRVRRTKEQQQKYKQWSKEARSLRDKCINGEVTIEYFEEWLSNTEKEMV